MSKDITGRQKAAIYVLLFVVQILDPSGYKHEISKLRDQIMRELAA